jgi:nucleotide-binding universal stress UspA family protein
MPHLSEAPQLSTYASIMVPLDLGSEAERRTRLACQLADQFSSRIIGIAAEEIIPPMYFEGSFTVAPSVIELEESRIAENLKQAEKLFRQVVGTRNNVEWRSKSGLPAAFIAQQSRACDLIVVSRQGSGDEGQGTMAVSPGDLIMESGRPILVVPPLKDQVFANRIIIAWKDTREARRAVWDSLPFLKRADVVFVVAIGGSDRKDSANDVSAYLARHGIASRTLLRPTPDGSVAEDILQVADDEGANLIVSGAYGHSRSREWMFGGVTRDLLNDAPVCCLMSH